MAGHKNSSSDFSCADFNWQLFNYTTNSLRHFQGQVMKQISLISFPKRKERGALKVIEEGTKYKASMVQITINSNITSRLAAFLFQFGSIDESLMEMIRLY